LNLRFDREADQNNRKSRMSPLPSPLPSPFTFPFIERGDGLQVGGQGFGCVILRQSVLDEHVIHHGGRGDYDPTLYAELRGTRWHAKVDWGCEVGHGESDVGSPQRK